MFGSEGLRCTGHLDYGCWGHRMSGWRRRWWILRAEPSRDRRRRRDVLGWWSDGEWGREQRDPVRRGTAAPVPAVTVVWLGPAARGWAISYWAEKKRPISYRHVSQKKKKKNPTVPRTNMIWFARLPSSPPLCRSTPISSALASGGFAILSVSI